LSSLSVVGTEKSAIMQSRAHALSPRRLFDRLSPLSRIYAPGAWSVLRVFGESKARDTRFGPAATLGWLGPLEVRLAQNAADVRLAQKLRYRVFYKEGSAVANATTLFARRDADAFDPICDHLLVIDHANSEARRQRSTAVVGTYRLLRQDVAERHGGFYSASEFDIDSLVRRHRGQRFLEVGRSCVLADYRNKRTLELLWHGIAAYVTQQRVDVLIGCASLDGTDPDRLALPLSYLHHFARAPKAWSAEALPERRVEMNRMPKEAIDPKAALRALPPLIKGYLRLGAHIGSSAAIDPQFRTTDVLIVLPLATMAARYAAHFGVTTGRRAA
jgi:L-ornithine Nalpha-acyltransferase